ncbi:CHAP domain-containing protein [Xanthovirga aplysinae]|uniref:CHAP domain-containing protein n=1 Tax=Xanthovirga aplysinae TaxID=2529853 RepID=UPI0012BC6161|nr:CHAP domain-containing protein [Xanthovirga aplysinae]MTI30864.1 CHAP domain-containing protein [Xanthovirga aplysinae]
MKLKRWTYLLIGVLILGFIGLWTFKRFNYKSEFIVGQQIDSLNGVLIYYNGGVGNVTGRNTTKEGYNLGLKFQCVEFVKRYYYEYLNHKMPDSYGRAKDFYDKNLKDGQTNMRRNLIQFSNPSQTKPKVDDLLIFGGTVFNKYGHVAIISNVTEDEIEIIQQNPGPFGKSRETFAIEKQNDKWTFKNDRILGWLRKK